MIYNFSNMGGIADTINNLEAEEDIKVFLTLYKKWYINEKKLSRQQAQQQVIADIKFFINKFIKRADVAQKFAHVLEINI